MTDQKVNCVRFTVLLDQFYTDHRKKALIGVNKSWRTIEDLENYLQNIFHLNTKIYLTIDDCLLPTSESISIINPMDSILVHHCQQSSQARPSPFTLLANAFSQAQIVSATPSTAMTSDFSSPKYEQPTSKRPKRNNNLDDVTKNDESRQTESPSKCSKWINDVNSLDDEESNVLQKVNKAQSSEVTSESSKPKRKRKRKSKSLKIARQQNEPYQFPTPPQSISKDLFAKQNLPQDLVNEKKRNVSHIRFDALETKPKNIEPNINETLQLPRTARVVRGLCTQIKLPTLESSDKIAATVEEAQSKINDSGIESDKPYSSKDNIAMTIDESQSESALESIRKNISNLNYKSLNGKPKENDLLAFKIFKLGENYIPELSEFIIGLVQYVNNEESTVTISIMAGIEQTKQPTGKFSLDLDGENNNKEDANSTVNLRFDELLEAKYVVLEN